jgi:t-SNARE complex subunit (syntaxin)
MTVEEKLALLQKEADEAEKLAVAAEQAADLRKKTAAARVRYQKALATSGATKKGRFTKSQMLMFIVVFIIFIFIMYSCMH